jgi:hypothetical protein
VKTLNKSLPWTKSLPKIGQKPLKTWAKEHQNVGKSPPNLEQKPVEMWTKAHQT